MRLKRVAVVVLFSAVLVFLLVQMYGIMRETSKLQKTDKDLSETHNALVEENERLEKELQFYAYPENIDKFLRSRFNYKRPGEQMIIVIPHGDE